jgi:hypothetical protein
MQAYSLLLYAASSTRHFFAPVELPNRRREKSTGAPVSVLTAHTYCPEMTYFTALLLLLLKHARLRRS